MIKKLGHIIFLIYFIVMVAGVSIHKHYCHSELRRVSVFVEAQSCCAGACPHCKDEVHVYKIQNDFTSAQLTLILNIVSAVEPVIHFVNITFAESYNAEFFRACSPPPLIKLRILSRLALFQSFLN